VANTIPYVATITVGADKNYQTINDALAAARAMVRPNKERVKIMIDPGNYEEMLVVDVDSVSLINASSSPSISLLNQGVGIKCDIILKDCFQKIQESTFTGVSFLRNQK
jgi:pectin methylesterase-like acyl-CoA thioesterase